MSSRIDRSEILLLTQSQRLPAALQVLEGQLESFRQEQLAKNRSRLRGLTREQQQYVELLTLAITRRILGEVTEQWKFSAAQGDETRLAQTVSLMWGLADSVSGLSG